MRPLGASSRAILASSITRPSTHCDAKCRCCRYVERVDTFAEIAAERRLLADLVEDLSAEQEATQSLCGAWTVHDVTAHLLMPLVTPMPKVVLAMVRNGMNFDRANVALTAGVAKLSSAEIAEGLRSRADHRFTPPGLGPEAPLTDIVVHGQDIRRPLGLTREIPEQRQRAVLDFMAGGSSKAVVPTARKVGLRLEATDLGWSAGEGALVSGQAEALMMALAGRPVALAELTGDGIPILSERLAAS